MRTIRRTVATIGDNTVTSMRIGAETKLAAPSELVKAYVLGNTSAKIKTNKVITKVARATPLSPNRRVNKLVAKAAAKIFTKLFPNKTAPIKRSVSSVKASARLAPRDPLSAIECNFPRFAAVKAVSDPEKKADKPNKTNIAKTVSQDVASKPVIIA